MEQKENNDQQGIQKIPYALWIKDGAETQITKELGGKSDLHHGNCMMRVKKKKKSIKRMSPF